ncbi:ubiquitin-protein ligase peroxin 12 [Rhodotorula sphaerocarpa]
MPPESAAARAMADPARPSIFELAAQEQLRDLLSPVVRYVLSVFAQRNPRYLLRIVNHHDSLFALCMWFVERHYLVKYGGSFAETFYGLKRRRTLRSGAESGTEERVKAVHELTGKSDNVRGREIYGSLAFLVVMPYLKTKAADLYERLGGGAEAEIFASSPTSAATPTPLQLLLDSSAAAPALPKRIELASEATFKLAYPYAKLLWQVYLLLYNLRYLFGKSKYWRPWYDWLGIEVRRLGQDDYLLTRPPSPSSPPTARPSLRQFLSRLVRLAPHLALDSLRVVLPLAIFGFRLLEWWYSPAGVASRLGRGRKDGAQPALRAPPPAARTAATEGSEASAAAGRGMCVVHGGPVENPTALPSGWIGCYKCLRRLEEEVQVETEVEDGKGGVQTVKGMKGTGKLRDPKTGEWVEVGRLRRIMG